LTVASSPSSRLYRAKNRRETVLKCLRSREDGSPVTVRIPKSVLCIISLSALVAACGSTSETDQERDPTDPDSEDSSHGGCGTERWSVKIGTDADASRVDVTHAQVSSIPTLVSLPAPSTLPAGTRVAPTETTLFRLVNVELTEMKSESDSDYHLVLRDTSGKTMIVEVPSPACATSSPWASQIGKARAIADANRGATGLTVTIEGVGFFDFIHGQTGVAPNGIELHPVLGLCVGKDCTISH
jgi:hypothetical protein